MNNLDRAINNEFLIVSKSLLPYLNVDRQKSIALFIKAMELIYTLNLYSNETSVRSMSRSQESGWEKEFLTDVRNNLPSDKAYFVDVILKLTEAKSLLNRQPPDEATTSPEYHLHPSDSGILDTEPFEPDTPSHITKEKSNPTSTPQNTSSNSLPSPDQIINGLSSLLDPNQTQILKLLSSFLPKS